MKKKIFSLKDLSKKISIIKKRGKKVVHCHGVFDILHAGHVKHFNSSKKYGDILVVTVTHDQYVNKGPNRPIFPTDVRMQCIAALENVDYVIHAAALSFPPESEKNQKIYFENNIKKTKTLIDLCVKKKIKKFIFLSSSNVYNFNPNNIKAASESQKNKPSNYYGKTKSIIEKYVKNKFEICYILRLFNIAGYINKKEFFEFKNKFRRIMPVITAASRKKFLFKVNLVKSKKKLIYPGF